MPLTETEWEAMPGFESGEGESESEAMERIRIPRPSGRPSFQRRTPPSYVTQVQLEAALSRVDGKIKTVSDGVSTLGTRVNTLTANIKKEAEDRKKDAQSQKADLNQKVQLLALLPLLTRPPTYTIVPKAIDGTNPTNPVTLSADSGGTLNALLPLLLVSGLGSGSGGLGLGGDGGTDNSLMLLALVLAMNPPSTGK
jgi:hypothetical protein